MTLRELIKQKEQQEVVGLVVTSAGCGCWESPISARTAARHDGRPGWVSAVGGDVWWTEPRPAENGRVALVRHRASGSTETVLPPPWSVRSRVHEYGGRAYAVTPAGDVVFAEYADQRLYRFAAGGHGEPVPLTPIPEDDVDRAAGLRYVEPAVSPAGDEVWCIREEFTGPAPTDVTRAIVAVPLDGSAAGSAAGAGSAVAGSAADEAVRVLVRDTHFLAGPRVSPDRGRLAWIGWNHPDMPWDSTVLRVAEIGADGGVGAPRTVAGGQDQAVVQAEWADDSTLLAVTDPDGWWNLYRIDVDEGSAPVALCRRDEEFGAAMWQLGMTWFAPLPDGTVAVIHGRAANRLGVLDPATGELVDIASPHTEWAATLATSRGTVVGIAGSPDRAYHVVEADPRTGEWHGLGPAGDGGVDPAYLPTPEARTFAGVDGRDVHANLYPPRNPDFAARDGERPPYVVFVHGGPTSRAPMVHNLEIAFFTSRGIGVVDVNYGGSTGHGREYRNRLRENWGVVDVQDCASVARALVAENLADPARLAIRGGSAGGWTSAAALTSVADFACGTIYYPILDLAGWRTGETHDFESRYLDSLVGPWPDTEQRYRERSPVNRAEKLSAPFLLLQGLDDEICPPLQCERLLERVRGVPHAYLTFEGEQHGFRREETIVAALAAELSLYGQVLGFEPAGIPRLELAT